MRDGPESSMVREGGGGQEEVFEALEQAFPKSPQRSPRQSRYPCLRLILIGNQLISLKPSPVSTNINWQTINFPQAEPVLPVTVIGE